MYVEGVSAAKAAGIHVVAEMSHAQPYAAGTWNPQSWITPRRTACVTASVRPMASNLSRSEAT